MKKIILASTSPRRRELLTQLRLDYTVAVSDADENVPEDMTPEQTVLTLARRKASVVAVDYPDCVVIGADTIVYLPDMKIKLGKPADRADAARMLRMLSGRRHTVYTGIAVISDGVTRDDVVCTDVIMKEMTDAEIEAYIRTGEPDDKAGAYGIQDIGGIFVERIEGEYFNVTGMPKSPLYKLLLQSGVNII